MRWLEDVHNTLRELNVNRWQEKHRRMCTCCGGVHGSERAVQPRSMLMDAQFYGNGISVIVVPASQRKADNGRLRMCVIIRNRKVSPTHARTHDFECMSTPQTCLVQ